MAGGAFGPAGRRGPDPHPWIDESPLMLPTALILIAAICQGLEGQPETADLAEARQLLKTLAAPPSAGGGAKTTRAPRRPRA